MIPPLSALCDANVLLGRDTRTGVETTPESIRDALAPWGTVCACVASLEALLYDPVSGNATALALARRDPFFRAVAVLNPHHPSAGTLAAQARADGFAFVRIFPDTHNFAIDGPACAELLDACDAAGLPIMFSLVAAGAAATARALAGRRGRYLLGTIKYQVQTEAFALSRRVPGVRLEATMLNTPDGLVRYVAEFGADRLFFGSGYPDLIPGCTHRVLQESGLEATDISRIASGSAFITTGGQA